MIALLGAMRKQMNGAVADAMRYYGEKYGLNYGVSLPTLRQIANQEQPDHTLAQYLYKQQVRELRLAALHIAQPEKITSNEADFWAEGVINSEVAEEMAFAMLSKAVEAKAIIDKWSDSNDELLIYTALMAASRNTENISKELILKVVNIAAHYNSSRIIAQGIVALLVAANNAGDEKSIIASTITKIKELAIVPQSGFSTIHYIAEELEWRIEA